MLTADKAKEDLIKNLEGILARAPADPPGKVSLAKLEVQMALDALKSGKENVGPVLQEEFWASFFGNDYSERNNNIPWRDRIPFWQDIVARTEAMSVLDVGTNCGWNLMALREIDEDLALWGVDVNEKALDHARAEGLSVANRSAGDLKNFGNFDVVATSGVLIHIEPDKLEGVMNEIIRASRKYVVAVEYASADPQESGVPYRGYCLWRRPFGKLYEGLGLKLLASGEETPGFPGCAWWLLEKP